MREGMRHGSLFSGIGGFDLAAEWMGWENVFHCEKEKFCQQVLNYYWPKATLHEDIRNTDFTIYRYRIDILTGGFPCQPYSTAGKRLGKEDDRHLWPEMLRAIREISPRWIVGENVRGLTNWNGGLVFDEVQTDLEAEGYEVIPFLLPACAVNAPHRRDRVWFIAFNPNGKPYGADNTRKGEGAWMELERHVVGSPGWKKGANYIDTSGGYGAVTNSNRIIGCKGRVYEKGQEKAERYAGSCHPRYARGAWENFPTQPPVCSRNDGLSSESYRTTLQNENEMDRNLVIKGALDEGRLEVDFATGKIYSTRQRGKEGQKIELPGSDCNGYIVHNIMYKGTKKQCRAHQIVWIAANGLYDKDTLMIDHINRDRKDNRLSNLRLVTAKGNSDNSTPYHGKLSDEDRQRLLQLYLQGNNTMRELASDFGISKSRVQQIISQEKEQLDGITFSKWRNESIKGYGNAVVPQVVYQIFKAIEQYETI